MPADITVVMAFKDSAEWLPETLRSLAAQKCDDCSLEVVLVDDRSTDASARVAEVALASAGIPHRLVPGPGEGPAAARNLGFWASTSEWVHFLDSDDLLHTLKTPLQWRVAKAAGPEVAVVYSSWSSLVLRDGAWAAEAGMRHAAGLDEGPIALARSEGFVPNGSQIFRRAWVERAGGYDASLHPIEDVGLQIRIAMLGGRFVFVPSEEPLFLYRRRRGSFSTCDSHRFHRACYLSIQRVESFYREAGALTAARSRELAQLYLMQARFAARHDPPAFGEVWDRIRALDPGFAPAGPPLLRRASRLFGYPRAERLSVWRERIRAARVGRPGP
jgi:GT2 family glycosyltransferase